MRYTSRSFLIQQAFYLAALPILYRSPRVLKPSIFFLHSVIPIPDDFDELSSSGLVQRGHFKLAALRYVRSLHFDSSWMYIADDDEDLQIGIDLKMAIEDASFRAVQEERKTAQDQLQSLPAGTMRKLETLRIGDIDYHRRDMVHVDTAMYLHRRHVGQVDTGTRWGESFSQNLATALLARGTRPRSWCERPSTLVALSIPLTLLTNETDTSPLPRLYIHIHLYDKFTILPGGTTHVYYHEHSRSSDTILDNRLSRIRVRSQAIGHGLGTAIAAAFKERTAPDGNAAPGSDSGTAKATISQSVIESTLVIFAESVPNSFFDGMILDRDNEKRPQDQYARDCEVAAREALQRYAPDLAGVRIEGRAPDAMPPCEVCGMHV
jgi:hypothetical protein